MLDHLRPFALICDDITTLRLDFPDFSALMQEIFGPFAMDDIKTCPADFSEFLNFDEKNIHILKHLSPFILICDDIKTLHTGILPFY